MNLEQIFNQCRQNHAWRGSENGPRCARTAMLAHLKAQSETHNISRRLTRSAQAAFRAAGNTLGRLLHEPVTPSNLELFISALNNLESHSAAVFRVLPQNDYADEIFECGECGNFCNVNERTHSGTSGLDFGACCEQIYSFSETQDTYINVHEVRNYYATADSFRFDSPDAVTSTWARSLPTYNGDYFSHEAYEELFSDQHDNEDEDEDSPNSVIGAYHSSKKILGHIKSAYDQRRPSVLLGLELEVEIKDRERSKVSFAKEVKRKLTYKSDKPYCHCENDGSLNHGFEIVTSYTGLDVHATVLKALEERPIVGLVSHNTTTCGLHVHVDKADMSMLHASKLVKFIHDRNNKDLIKCVARRYENGNDGYAKVNNSLSKPREVVRTCVNYKNQYSKSAATKNALLHLHPGRYEAVNFENEKTIEFRLFRGTLKYTTIMACLEFAYISWFFSRDSSANELSSKHFCQFILQPQYAKQTKFLRAYLREKQYAEFLAVDVVRKKPQTKTTPKLDDEEVFTTAVAEPVNTYRAEADARSKRVYQEEAQQIIIERIQKKAISDRYRKESEQVAKEALDAKRAAREAARALPDRELASYEAYIAEICLHIPETAVADHTHSFADWVAIRSRRREYLRMARYHEDNILDIELEQPDPEPRPRYSAASDQIAAARVRMQEATNRIVTGPVSHTNDATAYLQAAAATVAPGPGPARESLDMGEHDPDDIYHAWPFENNPRRLAIQPASQPDVPLSFGAILFQ